MSAGKRLISAAEAARRVGVDKSTMCRWIAAGKVPAFRTVGGHWRVRVVDIEFTFRPQTALHGSPSRD